ncbi:MAG: hypothetical protein ACFFDU_00875 [Candidatus Thorarchaeota archaeon]
MPISSRGLKATGEVAILEDADPWGYNDAETILLTYSHMVVDTIPSASFGIALGKYQKVIISSQQSASFYTAVESHRSWLEDYVKDGGVLEIHAARSSSQGSYLLPGGFGYTVNLTSNIEFADVGHYLLHNPFEANETELDGWTYSAHGYLNNTEGTSVIITDGAGEPVLIEARYGLGYFIITTQTVEYISANGYSDFLENLVWYVPTHESPPDEALTGPVAILENINPWGYNATQQILVDLGIPFDIINSTDLGTADLSPYQKVIISSSQPVAFYTALTTHRALLEAYVDGGGILEIHAATQSYEWILPFGAGFNYNLADSIDIIDAFHPTLYHPYLVQEPEFEYWGWSTHGYFNQTTGARIILDDGTEPVFYENASGDGFILATAQTVEWAWWRTHNTSMFLENLIRYIPHQQVHLQPDDYVDTLWETPGGNYYEFNFTCGPYLDDWRINITKSVQRFYSNDTLYDDNLYWFSLQTNTRYLQSGTTWWVLYHFIIMIPDSGLTIGSAIPLWGDYGIIVGEVMHTWVNGYSYDCWNVTWLDGAMPTYSYFEKETGVLLYSINPGYELTTVATNLIRQPPTVKVISPDGGETLNSTITVTWAASDPNDDTLTFDVDIWDGSNWNTLATGLTSTSYLLDTLAWPNGSNYRIRITAYDGIFSIADESDGVFTIDNPPIYPILPPGWWIAIVAGVIIIVVIIVLYLLMKRRRTTK